MLIEGALTKKKKKIKHLVIGCAERCIEKENLNILKLTHCLVKPEFHNRKPSQYLPQNDRALLKKKKVNKCTAAKKCLKKNRQPIKRVLPLLFRRGELDKEP